MKKDDGNPPIEVDYTGLAQESASVRLPGVLPRYWIYLASDGEQLGEREYALLVQVLLLREAQDFELRVSNLPARCPESSRTRALARLRRMGLVFTRRMYYPARAGRPPVQRAQRWDLRTLFFNLELVAQSWQAWQRQALAQWSAAGRGGPRPIYSFPPGFVHEVRLPAPVALDIERGVFYPVAPKWQQRARALLETLALTWPVPTEASSRGSAPDAPAAPGGQSGWTGQPGQPEQLLRPTPPRGEYVNSGAAVVETAPESAQGRPAPAGSQPRIDSPGLMIHNCPQFDMPPDGPGAPVAQEQRTQELHAQELRTVSPDPGAQPTRGRQADAPEMHGHLLRVKEEEEGEEESPALPLFIFAYFSERLGQPAYQPGPKEQAALAGLLRDGFTQAQIVAGIEAAFARPARPRHFTHCAAIARDLRRSEQAARQPETRTPPEARPPEARQPETRPAQTLPASQPARAAPAARPDPPAFAAAQAPDMIIEAHLAGAADVYRSTGRELTGDVLARFGLMAARCEAAAAAAGSSGGAWLAEALACALGVARPGSLLNYADKALADWTANGRSQPPPRKPRRAHNLPPDPPDPLEPRRRPPDRAEPRAYDGIRKYLIRTGGLEDGETE